MSLAPNSMGFGHGPFGRTGPFGAGPWITFNHTPGYTHGEEFEQPVRIVRFEDLSEQRFLLSRKPGLALRYQFTNVDSVNVGEISSFYIAAGGAATRFKALDHRTKEKLVVRFDANQDFTHLRGPGMVRNIGPITLRQSRAQTYAEYVMEDGPLSYWRLGEEVGVNSAMNRTTLAAHGSYIGSWTVMPHGALTLDDDLAKGFVGAGATASGCVRIPYVAGMAAATMTFELWLCQSLAQGLGGWAFSPGSGTYLGAFDDGLGQQVPRFNLYTYANGITGAVGTREFAIGQWTHLVGTFNGSTQRLYVDGVLEATEPLTTSSVRGVNSGPYWFIGRDQPQPDNTWIGGIDEVAVYSGALTAARVRVHYLAGKRRF